MPTSENGTAERPRFEFKQEGDQYFSVFHDRGIGVCFEALREHSGDIYGDITVQGTHPETSQRFHMQWGRLNLSSIEMRDRLAKRLEGDKRVRLPLDTWRYIVEAACISTARAHRKGEPFQDLSEGDAPLAVDYLLYPLLPNQETTSLFADGDSGKGWLALGVALALRLDVTLPGGLKAMARANTLYLDWETSYEENKRRLAMLARGFGYDQRPSGIIYRHMNRALADDIVTVRNQVAQQNIGLVIVDSAGPATGAELKDSDPVVRFMSALRTLSPATRLVLGHVSKETAKSRNSDRGRMFGSVFYENLSRSVWEVRSDTEGNPIALGFFHRKANMGRKQKPFGLALAFDDVNHTAMFGQQEIEEIPEVAQHAALTWRMEMALRRGSMSTKQLAEELQVTPSEVRTTATRSKGKIIRLNANAKGNAEAVWGLVASGREEA